MNIMRGMEMDVGMGMICKNIIEKFNIIIKNRKNLFIVKLKCTIKLNSFNCRGLRNSNKRLNIFNWLKTSHNGITLLQETHSAQMDEDKWTQEWGGKIHFAHGEYNARGVAILIPTNINSSMSIKEIYKDKNGRIILLNFLIEENPYIIINVYSPTKDNVTGQNNFLTELKELIETSISLTQWYPPPGKIVCW